MTTSKDKMEPSKPARSTKTTKSPKAPKTTPINLSMTRMRTTFNEPDASPTLNPDDTLATAFEVDTPFWQNIIAIKRDIKRLRKELRVQEETLNAAMIGVVDRFTLSPDVSERH